jgi:hypothetical protein
MEDEIQKLALGHLSSTPATGMSPNHTAISKRRSSNSKKLALPTTRQSSGRAHALFGGTFRVGLTKNGAKKGTLYKLYPAKFILKHE